jgi:amidase
VQPRPPLRLGVLLLVLALALMPSGVGLAQQGPPPPSERGNSADAPGRAADGPGQNFELTEATIAGVHQAFQRNQLTCEQLVQGYLDRIDAYDQAGPTINAVIEVNPEALNIARELDAEYRRGGLNGPLHCVPMLIKDNLDSADIPTTGGSLSLEGSTPSHDSFVVGQLREAGAVILAKSNLDEFARGAVGLSSLGGQTLNPYGLDRIPGGSSAGTGAGIAANFALAGIGTETGVSIRNPSTNNNLVGIAPTRGLVSQSGIIPISFTQDRAGPMARTVDDAARILEVIGGFDVADDQTSLSIGRIPSTYVPESARPGVSQRDSSTARVGVVRELFGQEPTEAETGVIIDAAIADLEAAGVTVVPDVPIQAALDEALPWLNPLYPNEDHSITTVLSDARTNVYEFKDAFNDYLDKRGDTPIGSLEELIESELFVERLRDGLVSSQEGLGLDDPEYAERLLRITALQRASLQTMAELDLDGLVFPMKTVTAPPIGGSDPSSTVATSGNVLSSITGFPSVVMPAGFAEDGLPVGLEIMGRPFTEADILEIAATYESVTDHRQLPSSTPPLND